MIDKRALLNEETYQKLEQDIKNLVKKMDFKKIAEEHKEIIEEVGDCIISCQNTVEAMTLEDAMGISLSIERPEAAIADPSRVKIIDIYPSYATCDSFLESLKFKLQYNNGNDDQERKIHGGFTN
jgi:hypothetical protein